MLTENVGTRKRSFAVIGPAPEGSVGLLCVAGKSSEPLASDFLKTIDQKTMKKATYLLRARDGLPELPMIFNQLITMGETSERHVSLDEC